MRAYCQQCDAQVPVGDDGLDRFGHPVALADGPGPAHAGPAEEPEPWVSKVDPTAAVDQPRAAPHGPRDQPVAAQRPAPSGPDHPVAQRPAPTSPVEEPAAWTAPVTASDDEGDGPGEPVDVDAFEGRYDLDEDSFDAASLEAAVAELGFAFGTADEGVVERDVERPVDDRWAAGEPGSEDRPATETTNPSDEDEADRWRLDLDEFGLDLAEASDPDVGGPVTEVEEQGREEPEPVSPAREVRGGF
ncbi:MAG TPA: hypothetical protein VHF25_11115, partial [Nitriliruptorales bacterium]|nr:hypothetical protein [Nitriliruptorales bacterium]